ncbi:MAG: hypothetical protein JNM69_28320 [Archangium sp.]|nr:hypothetical protein [Archangium sp.]
MRAACWLVLLPACVMRGVVPVEGRALASVGDEVARSVRCDTGSVPIEFANWRAAVERVAPSQARVDSATLSCRTVVVGAQPVVVGSNTPSIITLQQTELELRVELRWRLDLGCLRERWLGVSRWRVVPEDDAEQLGRQVAAALHDAASNAQLDSQVRVPCPSAL